MIHSGSSVSLDASGTVVAIGAHRNNSNFYFDGQVRIYKYGLLYPDAELVYEQMLKEQLRKQKIEQERIVKKSLANQTLHSQSRRTTLLINRRSHTGVKNIFAEDKLYTTTDNSYDTRLMRLKIQHDNR
jgi:hypothetical protein